MYSFSKAFAWVASFTCATLVSATAWGQAVQVLDSVDAFSSSAVLEMRFRDPTPRQVDFESPNVGGTAILACQRAADQGLYCLDGAMIRYWPDTKDVRTDGTIPDTKLFTCADKVLGLDAKKPNPCTSVTVDLTGAIWLAGRKANSHSLIKVVEKTKLGAACSATGSIATTWVELGRLGVSADAPIYCAREWAPGRPVLVDVNPVDGEASNGFTGVPGILGLEERKTVVFFPDEIVGGVPAAPIEFASGKTGWNLIGSEQLLSASLLQFGVPKKNYVLVTTTLGRVLAKKAATDTTGTATGAGTGQAFQVFDLGLGGCSGSTVQNYGIRVSSQSERVYVSDRRCQQIRALKWVVSPAAVPSYCVSPSDFCLFNAKEGPGDGTNVTLSTGSTTPDGLSVAPGIGIDLRDCAVGKVCPIVADGGDTNSYNAAEITGVILEQGSQSGLTVFQVRGLPDCRYWAGPGCTPGVLVADPTDPTRKYLDIAPLLPDEITSQFPGTLPQLLISPDFRGREVSAGKRTIDLFFGIQEPDVQFRGTFEGHFDIADLTTSEWGCAPGTQVVIGADGNPTPPDLSWDVVTYLSENFGTVGGPDGIVEGVAAEHVDTLVNTGCVNPTSIKGGSWSAYAYSMEVVPKGGDAIYALLMRSLYQDLKDAQDKTVCLNADDGVLADYPSAGTPPPLYGAVCSTLTSWWQAGFEKLDSCINGSTYPRQSAAVNNCQSFLSQLKQYEAALASAVRTGEDRFNRIGQQQARAATVRYTFESHFLPSIPPAGFCSISTAFTNCAPLVNAGPDATLTSTTLTLAGSVIDDGRPSGTLTTAWTKVSGPGTATFGNAASVTSTVTFSASGTYTLRLTANDGLLTASDDVVVTVQ